MNTIQKLFAAALIAALAYAVAPPAAAVEPEGPYQGAVTARVDTNVPTVAARYTPRWHGDILIGFDAGGTQKVFVAGSTNAVASTNDWIGYSVPANAAIPNGSTFTFQAGTLGLFTVTTNANVAGTMGVTGAMVVTGDLGAQDVNAGKITLATNQLTITAAAAAAPTNLVAGSADAVGINVTVNGTNYKIRATLN